MLKCSHETLPVCQKQNPSYSMAAVEDKQEKKKRMGGCTGSYVGVILGILVYRAGKVFERASAYSLL